MGELVIAPDFPRRLPVSRPVFESQIPQGVDGQGTGGQLQPFELPFSGAWVPDEDPLKIGIGNFADLRNLRYTNSGLEGVQGFTRLTTTALARPRQRSAIQFMKTLNGVTTSTLLVQALASDFSSSAVYLHPGLVPSGGDFLAQPLWVDGAAVNPGRFGIVPDGNVVYTNGFASTIWGTEQHRVGAFLNDDQTGFGFRYDVTERVRSISASTASLVTLTRDALGDIWLLVGSTRPLQGIRLAVQTPNTAPSTTQVEYWNGSAWALVTGLVDETSVAGVTLAQTGTLRFASTQAGARVKFESGYLLYFYRVWCGATGSPDAGVQLSACTVDAPWQPIVDVWDGIERTPVAFVRETQDYSLEVLEPSAAEAPIAANLNGLGAGDPVYVGFEERMTVLHLRLIAGKVNAASGVVALAYWNGAGWTPVPGLSDTTASATGVPLGNSGSLIWSAPAATSEYKQTLFGRTLYYYRLTWSVALTSADILIDTVTGLPAQRWNASNPIPGYLFPFSFAGRAMLAGSPATGEMNRIDYSAVLRPDVWNGEQASDEGKAIYIGDHAALTSAIELSNRFAGTLTAMCLLHKRTETWILQGSTPDTFQTFRLSTTIGNPAPLSLALAEIPFAVDQQAVRTVALWCSAKGPVMSEGSVIIPMRFPQADGSVSSIDAYFRPVEQDARGVNTAALDSIRGWYDPLWTEYNLLLPSGAGQTVCTVWLACDLRRRKWFRKVPQHASGLPQMGVNMQDHQGATYVYGGLDNGHLLRLEHGTTWDGTPITHLLDTADVPYTQGIFDQTRLRYLKVAAVLEGAGDATITYAHARDGTGGFTPLAVLSLNAAGRYAKHTQAINELALTHQWRVTCVTSAHQRAPRLLGMACLFSVERQELTL